MQSPSTRDLVQNGIFNKPPSTSMGYSSAVAISRRKFTANVILLQLYVYDANYIGSSTTIKVQWRLSRAFQLYKSLADMTRRYGAFSMFSIRFHGLSLGSQLPIYGGVPLVIRLFSTHQSPPISLILRIIILPRDVVVHAMATPTMEDPYGSF